MAGACLESAFSHVPASYPAFVNFFILVFREREFAHCWFLKCIFSRRAVRYAYCCAGWGEGERLAAGARAWRYALPYYALRMRLVLTRMRAVAAAVEVAAALAGGTAGGSKLAGARAMRYPYPSVFLIGHMHIPCAARPAAGRAAAAGALVRGIVDASGSGDGSVPTSVVSLLGRLARTHPSLVSAAAASVEGGALVPMVIAGLIGCDACEDLRATAIGALGGLLSALYVVAAGAAPAGSGSAVGARARVGSWLRGGGGGGGGGDKTAVTVADDADLDGAGSAGGGTVPAWADAFASSGGYVALSAALSKGPLLGARVVGALLDAIGDGGGEAHPTRRGRATTSTSEASALSEDAVAIGVVNPHALLLVMACFGCMGAATRVNAVARVGSLVRRSARARAWLLATSDPQVWAA